MDKVREIAMKSAANALNGARAADAGPTPIRSKARRSLASHLCPRPSLWRDAGPAAVVGAWAGAGDQPPHPAGAADTRREAAAAGRPGRDHDQFRAAGG